MYQIGHRAEGSLPFNILRSIELVDATDELGAAVVNSMMTADAPARLFRNSV